MGFKKDIKNFPNFYNISVKEHTKLRGFVGFHLIKKILRDLTISCGFTEFPRISKVYG